MGLDTVELVVAFEKHFQLEIPDPIAEQMGSVGDVAVWVGQQLGTTEQRLSVIRINVAKALKHLLFAEQANEEGDKLLKDLLPDLHAYQEAARRLQDEHGLLFLIPDSIPRNSGNGWLRKLFAGFGPEGETTASLYKLSQLVDWTVAYNYEKLLMLPLTSQYEVEQAVIGITANKSGVDIPNIKLSSRFAYELGMD